MYYKILYLAFSASLTKMFFHIIISNELIFLLKIAKKLQALRASL